MAAHDDGVQTITATVHTAGRSRDVTTVEITRELPTTGPASLPAGGGMTAGTGALTLEDPGQAIEVRRGSPWFRDRGWPPALGDPVEVDVVVDGEPSHRFTGVIEDVAGSTTEPVDAAIVDPIDRLHRFYRAEPIARGTFTTDADGSWREVDPYLRHEHHVTAAMRECGYYPTAVPADFYVPMTGSVLPTNGRLTRCDPGQSAQWKPTPFGMGIESINAEWALPSGHLPRSWDFAVYVAPGSSSLTWAQFQIIGQDQFAERFPVSEVLFRFPTSTTLEIEVWWDTISSTRYSTPYQPGEPVRVRRRFGSPSTILHGDTEVWSGNVSSSGTREDEVRHVTVSGSGVLVGSVYFAGANAIAGPATARLHMTPVLTGTLDATPYIERVDAFNFLRTIAEHTLSDMWLDREGVLHWAGVGALATRPPVGELTATADLLDLAWEETTANVRRRVEVTCESPAVTASPFASVLLWEGTAETMEENGEVVTVWATAPDGQDWIEPSNPTRITSGDVSPYGSVMGGVRVPPNAGSSPLWASTAYLTTSALRVSSQAFKIEHRTKSLPTGNRVELRAMPNAIRPSLSESPLPRIRGRARIDWSSVTHAATQEGPEYAADYEHAAGPWVQGADCAVLADWIAGWVTDPGPVLRELPIVYRTDLELGQVVEVVEDAVYHVRVLAVVVGMTESHAAGSSDMTVTLRVLALSQQPATLATYDQVWAGGTLGERDAEWSGQTLAEFDANPLRRD